MGSIRKLSVIMVLLLVFSIGFVIIYGVTPKRSEHYTAKLITILNEQEDVTVHDIFSFKFEQAYVFNDCYISGEGFAKKYNLDISINEVKSGVSENIQRIVFVDESGNFVYEFKCDSSEVILSEKGIVIYPETTIERESSIQEKTLTISFRDKKTCLQGQTVLCVDQ